MKKIKFIKRDSNLNCFVTIITPEIAQQLLDRYIHNRPTSNDSIRKYAKQMAAGKWKLNGEPIIIDSEGYCVNGFHRLSGCISSGTSFETLVVEGVEHETWTTVDTGKVRSAGDVFGIAGITNPISKASIVAKFVALCNGLNGLADSGSLHRLRCTDITREDLLNKYLEFQDKFDEIISMCAKYSKYSKGLVPTSMLGGMSSYLYIDKAYTLDYIDEFWNRALTSALPLYTSGRGRLLNVRGQDKQKVITDMWDKYRANKESVRVNITAIKIFE